MLMSHYSTFFTIEQTDVAKSLRLKGAYSNPLFVIPASANMYQQNALFALVSILYLIRLSTDTSQQFSFSTKR